MNDKKIVICYNRDGKIVAILPEELKPDDTLITCISIKKIIHDDTVNGD